MTKSFPSKNIEPKRYTMMSFLSATHINIHISIRKIQPGDRMITHSYNGTPTSNGERQQT